MTQDDQLRTLVEIEAIKQLKASYCYLVDAGSAGDSAKIDELLELFTEDAKGDYGPMGTYEGKEALTKLFKEASPEVMPFSAHMVHNPIINVDEESATGWWYFEISCTIKPLNKAVWIQGKYEDEYVKVEGKWKFKSIKATINYFTPFDEGWVKTKFLQM